MHREHSFVYFPMKISFRLLILPKPSMRERIDSENRSMALHTHTRTHTHTHTTLTLTHTNSIECVGAVLLVEQSCLVAVARAFPLKMARDGGEWWARLNEAGRVVRASQSPKATAQPESRDGTHAAPLK